MKNAFKETIKFMSKILMVCCIVLMILMTTVCALFINGTMFSVKSTDFVYREEIIDSSGVHQVYTPITTTKYYYIKEDEAIMFLTAEHSLHDNTKISFQLES